VGAQGREADSGIFANSRPARDLSHTPLHSKASIRLQAKLRVNAPEDVYEQEANSVAEQVMSMPEEKLQGTCGCDTCSECQGKQTGRERLQTKHAGEPEAEEVEAPPIVHEVLRSPGRPLNPSTREFMESRFGHDFSHVRVHADGRAAESARAVNALAYTVGRNVVFGAGQYQPGTSEGKRLLAHELAHTVQQSNGFQTGAAAMKGAPTLAYRQTAAGAGRRLMKQQADKTEGGPNGGGPGDGGGKTFDPNSIKSDLNQVKSLNISGTALSVASDAQQLFGAIKTLRSVTQRTDKLSVSPQSAQNIASKVSALNNGLATAAESQPKLKAQQSMLAGVSAATLTGAEPVGLAVILEILAEIVAVIAEIVAGIVAILEAPVVVVVAVIVLVIWLIYEIVMAIVEAADRALCLYFYEQCVHRRKKVTYCDDCMGECEKAGGVWPAKCSIPGLFR
jgi:hypothetical protein